MLLSPEIFGWPAQQCEWTAATSQLGQLANKEWGHGHLRLNSASTGERSRDEDLMDAMTAFWRAVERRQQLFDKVYEIRVLLGLGRRERINLNHLQELGLIRGSVLDEIRRLRNAIQHNSEVPPELSQCLLYQDAIWYFLRSTEPFARRIPTAYELIADLVGYSRGDVQERIEIKMRPPYWVVEVIGEAVSPEHYSTTSRDSWIPVESPDKDIRTWPDGRAFLRGRIADQLRY